MGIEANAAAFPVRAIFMIEGAGFVVQCDVNVCGRSWRIGNFLVL